MRKSIKPDQIIFALAYLIAAAFPFLRFWIGPIPIYLMDVLLIIALLLNVVKLNQLPRLELQAPVLLIVLLLLISIPILWVDTGILFDFMYRNGRRVISTTAFFVVGWISLRNINSRLFFEKIIILGVVIHASLIVSQYFLSLIGPNLLLQLDSFYYNILSSLPNASRVNLWFTSWYTPRAFGGYWHPNVAVAAVIIPLPFLLKIKKRFWLITSVFICIFAIILTSSRQGLLVLLCLAIFILLSNLFSKNITKLQAGIILFGSILMFTFVLSAIPKTGQRLTNAYEDDTVEIAYESRADNYPLFMNYMFREHPEYLILGQGIDFISVLAHSDTSSNIGGGFVSNSWLLTISQQGLVTFCIFLVFYIGLFRRTKGFLVLQTSVLGFGLLALLDNHIAIYESLQLIFWTISGLAANYRLSTQNGE